MKELEIQANQCFYCGKEIQDEDLIMKNVRLSILDEQSQRRPFHKECWSKYHASRMKKNTMLGVGILELFLGILVTLGVGWYYMNVFLGLIALCCTIVVFIGLIVAYYRVKARALKVTNTLIGQEVTKSGELNFGNYSPRWELRKMKDNDPILLARTPNHPSRHGFQYLPEFASTLAKIARKELRLVL